jgi:uncharacterized RDD family membrane protein YckC
MESSPFTTGQPTPSVLAEASKAKRFINALIDGTIIGIAVNIITYILALVGLNGLIASLLYIVIYLAAFYFYYTTLEGGSGQTIGKRVTGTKAVMADGSPLTPDALRTRTLWRLIPIVDAVTFLLDGPGWHDRFSNTRVVEIKS